jgi:uncharacterized protein (DUF2336 family)
MSSWGSFVGEVEDAVASGDPIRRVDTLRRMTNLFVEQAPNLKEEHVTVFDEVILRLARDLEFKARVELSERMADVGNAPRKVVRDLAFDKDINVAGPVIERSTRLDEDDLVAIAHDRGQDHLFALSRRSTLSERVTDILVDRGDQRVVRSVADNQGARFSERGFTQLMTKAREDSSLQNILKARGDIPPKRMEELVAIAREKVRESLREEFSGAAGDVFDAAIDDVASAAAETVQPNVLVNDFEAATATVRQKARAGGLVEDDVVDWVKAGQMEEAIAAIAHLAGVPVEMVARAYHAAHYDPLLFIVRSIKFGWGTFKLLLTVKAGRQPSSDVIKSAFDSFQQLSVQTAQRVVRFTAVREQAMQPNAA